MTSVDAPVYDSPMVNQGELDWSPTKERLACSPYECVAYYRASSSFLTGNDLRIEIAVTPRKQTEGTNSNR
jgi:hypothetical protein